MFKHNLAERAASLTYHIEAASNGAAYVVWDGEVSITADELLSANSAQAAARRPRTQAEQLLLTELASTCKPSTDVQATASAQGIAPKTLSRAKSNLKIRSQRDGFGPGSQVLWCLPEIHEERAA
jgi:hypothetical protein